MLCHLHSALLFSRDWMAWLNMWTLAFRFWQVGDETEKQNRSTTEYLARGCQPSIDPISDSPGSLPINLDEYSHNRQTRNLFCWQKTIYAGYFWSARSKQEIHWLIRPTSIKWLFHVAFSLSISLGTINVLVQQLFLIFGQGNVCYKLISTTPAGLDSPSSILITC